MNRKINTVYTPRDPNTMKKKSIFTGETEIIKEKKPLFLVIQKEYFDEIVEGTKQKEYRDDTEFYYSRFLNKSNTKFKNYDCVILQNGYRKDAKRITVKVKKITLSFRFVIHLGEIIDKNF